MDTESNQKTRRFTKIPWCKERGKDPYKKARSRSQEARGNGPAGAACKNIAIIRKVNPEFGAWMLAAALAAAVLILGGVYAG